jgi:hypothetical protein
MVMKTYFYRCGNRKMDGTGSWFTELADLVGEKYEARVKAKKSVYRKLKWHYSIQDKKPIHFAIVITRYLTFPFLKYTLPAEDTCSQWFVLLKQNGKSLKFLAISDMTIT